ncbi:MAG TPA: nicotinamide-nucleotide adenylyltransferase [Candidatus Bathyarchaeia archaeon]|nr:nicotinamide-nucleotide adenylyltransferase [Candidatus Bathyarchaeia archaeon]
MVKRGLFVGRFQPFHMGHLAVIMDILEEVDEIIIVIGSAQYSHRIDNPFTTGERLTMIHHALKEAKIQLERCWIVPVPDVHRHMLWAAEITGYTPKFEVAYANDPLTSRLLKEADFKVKPCPFHKRELYSATEVRKRMLEDKNWETLVPKSVVAYIKEIDGVQRLQDLNKTDRV